MYTSHEVKRRNELGSLVNLSYQFGFDNCLHNRDISTCNQMELDAYQFFPKTKKDERRIIYFSNRIASKISSFQKSENKMFQAGLLLSVGWSLDKICNMLEGFNQSYCGLLEKRLDLSEGFFEDLFLAETVNYSEELDRYTDRFYQYASMNWDAKPQPRNPVLRENRKGIIGFLRGLRIKK